jgi:UPF0755 protein
MSKIGQRKRWLFPAAAAFAILAAVASVAFYLHQTLYVPIRTPGSGVEIEFRIERGEKLDSIALRLQQAGSIRDPAALKLAAFLGGGGAGIKAGTHRLRTDLSAWEIFQLLQRSPAADFIRVVIPEGFDSFEIALLAASAGICSQEDFLAAVADPSPIADIAPQATSLEGYLFPDTYHVPVGSGAKELLAMMLKRFREVADTEMVSNLQAAGFTLHNGVILASLIAKEAGNAEEMPLISSVFHNRLSIGMKLDCDPTFIYARKLAGRWDGVVQGDDRSFDSPYNTYIHNGLPPGPIGSPGRDALLAVIAPADSDFFYFVAKGPDTSEGHYFSRTAKEHRQAVEKYRREIELSKTETTRNQ